MAFGTSQTSAFSSIRSGLNNIFELFFSIVLIMFFCLFSFSFPIPADVSFVLSAFVCWVVHPNRGNALFARRAQQSTEWIVDEVAEGVIDAARDKVYRNMIGARSVSPALAYATLPKTFPSPPPAIPGPVFEHRPPHVQTHRTSLTPEPNKALEHQFRDFNARIKPFFRVLWRSFTFSIQSP